LAKQFTCSPPTANQLHYNIGEASPEMVGLFCLLVKSFPTFSITYR
jgi:hypothetical protein